LQQLEYNIIIKKHASKTKIKLLITHSWSGFQFKSTLKSKCKLKTAQGAIQ